MSEGEVSPGGSEIFRHEAHDREFELAPGDDVLLEGMEAHLDRFFPEAERTVFHELLSDLVHLDVHLVPPGPGRDWQTLVTSGMAERPMSVPEGVEHLRYAELTLAVPEDWTFPAVTPGEGDGTTWPLAILKFLGRLPHEYDTWLGVGHTIPNGDPPEPFAAATALCGAIVGAPVLVPEEFQTLTLDDGRIVNIYAVYPIHADEMDYKLEQGADALWRRFGEEGVTELVDPGRPSVVRRRGLFRRR